MATEQQSTESAYEKLNDRQRLFLDDYLKHGKGAKAARKLDLQGGSARVEAHRMLTNANVLAAKAERLASLSIDAAEVTKQISDIGKTRLNDYFKTTQVQGYQQQRVTLTELIAQKEGEIDFIREYMNREGLISEEQQKPFLEKIATLRLELLDYLLKQEQHGGDATLLVAGKPVVVEQTELDMVKLAKAKGLGRIKSYTVGKDGVKVETYDALGALNLSARMLGLFEKDNEQSRPQVAIIEVVAPAAQQKGARRGQ